MNPKSDYEKIFKPEQIHKLLHNSDSPPLSPRQIKAEQSLLLGQPAIYPKKMVSSLKELLATHSHVKKAYIAVMHDTALDVHPHLLVGIDADGDVQDLFKEVGDAASLNSPKGDPVDLYQLTADKDQLSHYFLTQSHPFYHRSLGNKVKSWFRIG